MLEVENLHHDLQFEHQKLGVQKLWWGHCAEPFQHFALLRGSIQ
jgi:hypothetical protein